jgi:hypothetical protein
MEKFAPSSVCALGKRRRKVNQFPQKPQTYVLNPGPTFQEDIIKSLQSDGQGTISKA